MRRNQFSNSLCKIETQRKDVALSISDSLIKSIPNETASSVKLAPDTVTGFTFYLSMTKTKPHPLCAIDKPWGIIYFIHKGKKRKFYTMINQMTGSRMTAFDWEPPSIDNPIKWIKSVFQDIREKSEKVISQEGTKHFQ